jgi:putative CocE/NonD family hydrolase
MTFRDDKPPNALGPDLTVDAFSPHTLHERARASGAAVYSYSGWRDGGYPHSAVKRFAAVRTPGSRLTLGPWPHAGKLRIRPFDVAATTRFDQDAELLAFFDEHVRGRSGGGDGAPVHYFTMVEGRWKSSSRWPPEGTAWEAAYVGEGRSLRRDPPRGETVDAIAESGASATGERSRWRSLLSLVPGDYPDRAARDRRLLVYDGAPLEDDLEVTGHPVVTLFVSSSHDDGHVFAYLEDVAPSGGVAYVTEGQLRLLHRRVAGEHRAPTGVPLRTFARADAAPLADGEIVEVAFDLQPISWLFRRGHRVRLALAGADADHFDVMAPRTLRVHAGPSRPSRVDLPVAPWGR